MKLDINEARKIAGVVKQAKFGPLPRPLVFVPFPPGLEEEYVADFDQRVGLNYCLYVPGGLVTTEDTAGEYVQLVKRAAKFFLNNNE